MGSLKIIQLLLCSILLCICSPITTFSADTRPLLGFTTFTAHSIDQYDAKVVSQQLRAEIEKAGTYKTIPFSAISQRLAEQNLPEQCSDVQSAVIAGQILGSDYFAIGSLDKIGKSIAVSIQIVEVRSGRVVNTISEFYKGNFKKFRKNLIPIFALEISGIEVDEKKKRKK